MNHHHFYLHYPEKAPDSLMHYHDRPVIPYFYQLPFYLKGRAVIVDHHEMERSPSLDENGILTFAFLNRENEAHHDRPCYHYMGGQILVERDYHPLDIDVHKDPRGMPFYS